MKKAVAPLTGAWIETWYDGPGSHEPRVAPLTGAWIETFQTTIRPVSVAVAPLTGAWIETSSPRPLNPRLCPSHPSRVRGLKLNSVSPDDMYTHVAPLTGAWIETYKSMTSVRRSMLSHPSRVRGLKPQRRCYRYGGIRRTPHGCVD